MIKLFDFMIYVTDVILPVRCFHVFSMFNKTTLPTTLLNLVDVGILLAFHPFLHEGQIIFMPTQIYVLTFLFFAYHAVGKIS